MFSFSNCPYLLTAFACTLSCMQMWIFIGHNDRECFNISAWVIFQSFMGQINSWFCFPILPSQRHTCQPCIIYCHLHFSCFWPLQELFWTHLRPPALLIRIVFAFALRLQTISPHLWSCTYHCTPSYNLFSGFLWTPTLVFLTMPSSLLPAGSLICWLPFSLSWSVVYPVPLVLMPCINIPTQQPILGLLEPKVPTDPLQTDQ